VIVNILGPGGAGKTTLAEFLESEYPDQFSRLVTYTNRSQRLGEVDGKSYHFTSDSMDGDQHVLRRIRGGVIYAARKADFDVVGKILITTFPPRGVLKLEHLGYDVCSFYLELSEPERTLRMINRGDNEDVVKDRILYDDKESIFSIVQQVLSPREVFILDAVKPVDVLASEIKKKIEKIFK
jgi:thymidylate kinase